MIEMEYKDRLLPEPIVLTKGLIGDYKYVVINTGLYPECYIQLPLRHRLGRRNIEFISNYLKLHGEISYFGINSTGEIPYLNSGNKILGWSYSQLGDYIGYYKKMGYTPAVVMKEWKTEEIVEDVKEAIEKMKGFQNGELF